MAHEERRRLDEALKRATVSELASVSQAGAGVADPGGRTGLTGAANPLLTALRAVAQSQDIVIRDVVTDADGQDALQQIADASGVRIRKVQLTGRWWQRDSGPLLGFLADSAAPVALLPSHSRFSRRRYDVLNPDTGRRQSVDLRFASKLSRVAYVLYPDLPDRPRLRDLIHLSFSGLSRDITVGAACGIAAALLGMLAPQAMAVIVDYAIPDANRNLLLSVAIGLGAAALGVLLFDAAQSASLLRIETTATGRLQAAVWNRLLRLRPAFFRGFTAGDLESRADAVSMIRQRLGGGALRVLFAAGASLLNGALMFYYSASLALVAIALGLAVAVLIGVSGAAILRLTPRLQDLEGRLAGLMVQLVDAVPKLRVAAAEQRAFTFWAQTYSSKERLYQSIRRLQDRIRLLGSVVPILASSAIFWTATQFVYRENAALSLGNFLAFNAAFAIVLSGLTTLSETGISLLSVPGLSGRMGPIIEAEPEVQYSASQSLKLAGNVRLTNVTFRYRDDGPLTLDDVSIEASAGECIALVGPSGSGKSTILNLLLGFEKPLSGAVYYDNHDLKGLNVTDVRRQFGVVLQENKIMAGSLFENIACGGLSTIGAALEAARAAGLEKDIEQMPMGIHTVVSEGGTNLSGGQRQRVLIARALLLKPRMLILDEATSALDNGTQAVVSRNLENMSATRILVAHRLSTIRNADRIYVIDGGRVVQSGTFQSLVQQDGLFARLMARQMA